MISFLLLLCGFVLIIVTLNKMIRSSHPLNDPPWLSSFGFIIGVGLFVFYLIATYKILVGHG